MRRRSCLRGPTLTRSCQISTIPSNFTVQSVAVSILLRAVVIEEAIKNSSLCKARFISKRKTGNNRWRSRRPITWEESKNGPSNSFKPRSKTENARKRESEITIMKGEFHHLLKITSDINSSSKRWQWRSGWHLRESAKSRHNRSWMTLTQSSYP